MLQYFDILYIRIYRQYLKWGEEDIPRLMGILVISLFQSFNVITIYFLVRSLFEEAAWSFPKLQLIAIMVLIAFLDYYRIFRIVGFDQLLAEYDKTLKHKKVLHPIFYFIISIGFLVILRLLGLFPHVI